MKNRLFAFDNPSALIDERIDKRSFEIRIHLPLISDLLRIFNYHAQKVNVHLFLESKKLSLVKIRAIYKSTLNQTVEIAFIFVFLISKKL